MVGRSVLKVGQKIAPKVAPHSAGLANIFGKGLKSVWSTVKSIRVPKTALAIGIGAPIAALGTGIGLNIFGQSLGFAGEKVGDAMVSIGIKEPSQWEMMNYMMEAQRSAFDEAMREQKTVHDLSTIYPHQPYPYSLNPLKPGGSPYFDTRESRSLTGGVDWVLLGLIGIGLLSAVAFMKSS